MKLRIAVSILFVAVCAALDRTVAADPVPPPPPPPTSAPSDSGSANSSAAAGGRAALMAGMAHHPMAGLIKAVEEKGKMTKEEFLEHAKKQAEEGFARLDKNHDGVIDKSEIAEIESQMKGLRDRMQERGKGKGKGRGEGQGLRKRPGAEEKPDPAKPASDTAKPSL
ncbi:MAG TPA: hypothetical protein VGH65_08240 [Verrucomicrobiaceae bacterium]